MPRKRLNKNDAPKQLTDNEIRLGESDFIVSKTDTRGIITYANRIFVEISGYRKEEIIGANHNLIRHPDMPRIAFKLAWDAIQAKKEFFGFVKNLRADGGYYWVFAYITPDLDPSGKIIGYTSFRRRPSEVAVAEVSELYKLLRLEEQRGGMQASQKLLESFLEREETTYEKLIHDLQLGEIA